MSFANVSLVALIGVATILRFFRIYELTEFLADQGRTGIVIYQALVEKSLPLAGPPVLTGQHLGPFFYYLVGPSFILANFNPLGPALFMAILGVLTVVLVFYLGKKLFGFWTGFFIAALYAVSPILITQTRTLWDPTPIPFFVLLLIFSLYKIYEERNFRFLLAAGVLLGILVQLHYPNVFFIPVTIVFLAYVIRMKTDRGSLKKLLGWSLIGTLAFIGTLFPFLVYEIQHSFVDIREIALIFLLGGEATTTVPFVGRFFDVTARLFHMILPFTQWATLVLAAIIMITPLVRPRFWHTFFLCWCVSGVLAISLYKGTMHNHYLNFLVPVPFFLLGYTIKTSFSYINRNILVAVGIALLFFNLRNVDIFSKGNNDILRTKRMTNEIIEQANDTPFSFTITSSRSFTDLHYRYFFLLHHVKPETITGTTYDLLFLACEKQPCSQPLEKEVVQVMCYDAHCEGEYPKLFLEDFALISAKEVFDGKIFTYKRKQNANTD